MGIFRRKKKEPEKTEVNTSALPAVDEQTTDTADETVRTTLMFHPDWDVTEEEKYVYMYKHQQLPLLKPNQISITGIKLLEYNDGFVVVAFLRNTLDRPVQFEAVDLLLLDETGQAIAKKAFELDGLDELPPYACRPWRFLFANEDKLVETMPKEGWKIAFQLKQPKREHQLDLHETWEEQISPVHRDHLEKLVASLPELGPNEINIMGFEAKMTNNGQLNVSILIRNGSDKNIKLEQIGLVVEDAVGDIVCQGGFLLGEFIVKANTSKPWTFTFPSHLIKKADPDLSKFKVYTPKQK